MYTKANVMALEIQFQTALNRKTERLAQQYKVITNSTLYFRGTISYFGRTGDSDVVCYFPHGPVNISVSCSKDLRSEILKSTLGIILRTRQSGFVTSRVGIAF